MGETKSRLQQHGKKHYLAAKQRKSKSIQTVLGQKPGSAEFNNFAADLCRAVPCSNLPWNRLNNPSSCSFLEKCCSNQHVPDESTIRKYHLDIVYNSTIGEIHSDIGEHYI